MVVAKLTSNKFFIFFILVTFTASCQSTESVIASAIIDNASRKILEATAAYGSRVEYCNKRVEDNQLPSLDSAKLKSLKITRKQAISAIAFLQFRNAFECEKAERQALAFYLGMLKDLKRQAGVGKGEIETIQSQVSYPSRKELELEVHFQALSEAQQEYFESVVGYEVFDLMAALEKNKLLISE